MVWASLALSMSLVGGVLAFLVEDTGAPTGGLTLSPMVAIAGSSGIESVFRTSVPVEPARWDSIVITHSASPFGSPESLEARQRELSQQGLGFHFIVGNGSGMGNGDIHVGYRWLDQQPGLQVFSQTNGPDAGRAISICLVGDGNRRPFTNLQVQRLAQLVATIARQLDIPADRVYLQSQLSQAASPGRYFPEAQFRELLAGLR